MHRRCSRHVTHNIRTSCGRSQQSACQTRTSCHHLNLKMMTLTRTSHHHRHLTVTKHIIHWQFTVQVKKLSRQEEKYKYNFNWQNCMVTKAHLFFFLNLLTQAAAFSAGAPFFAGAATSSSSSSSNLFSAKHTTRLKNNVQTHVYTTKQGKVWTSSHHCIVAANRRRHYSSYKPYNNRYYYPQLHIYTLSTFKIIDHQAQWSTITS